LNLKSKIFLTTTLPYANSIPHIGHCLEFVLADFIKRYKSKNNDVYFNVGLDEHGTKILESSKVNNISINEFLNQLNEKWKDFCFSFNISYDNFYRTTDKNHKEKVQKFWSLCLEKGDLYKKSYKSKYCVGCESFKTEKDLIGNKCSDHLNIQISEVEEENWFFKLKKYKNDILDYVQNNSFLYPNYKIDELKNIIENTEDLSVSRLKNENTWGITVPNDENQIIYVWFDALLNYIISCGWDKKDSFESYWKNSIQICGPDNLRFQALIFQAFLKSQNIPFSSKLLIHGTVLDKNGNKMSKSTGNVVDPIEQLEKFGLEAIRYYILAGLNTFSDNKWLENDLITLYNSHLVNNFGNLISRTLHLIDVYNIEINDKFLNNEYVKNINEKVEKINNLFDNFEIKDGISLINEISTFCNVYITEKEPWKNESCRQEVLNNLFFSINQINELYYPIIPNKYNQIKQALMNKKKEIIFERK
jgi:methionyl-tRNA synthetase